MCLVVLAWETSTRYPLVFAANRDERRTRPALAAGWWPDQPQIFGGRDLVAHGGWLAVDRAGRFAAVTNQRDAQPQPAPRSRGDLVVQYLTGVQSNDAFLHELGAAGAAYGPFSLLLFNRAELTYGSNRAPAVQLNPGIHALSNAPFGVEWPKTRTAVHGMRAVLDLPDPTAALFDLLAFRDPHAEGDERYRSSLFIDGAVYGTRCSTVILIDAQGELTFTERSFDGAGAVTGEVSERFRLAALSRSDAA